LSKPAVTVLIYGKKGKERTRHQVVYSAVLINLTGSEPAVILS